MVLHLGEDTVIAMKDVVAILDLSTNMMSKDSQAFLKEAEQKGLIQKITQGEHKSCVIAHANKQTKLYYSPISTLTLQRRGAYVGENLK